MLALLVLLLSGCASDVPDWCAGRADDGDCDGVPDIADQCPASPVGELTNRQGCTEAEAAGCSVRLLSPDDRERAHGATLFRWEGDCDVYLLQFAEDPAFPAGATRTALRTTATEAAVEASEPYWRVVGGLHGVSTGAATPPREVRWR